MLEKNFLTNYCDWCEGFSDAPPQYNHYIAYWILGTLIGRRVWMKTGDDFLYPNIWLVILGASSFYRKSTSLTTAQRIVSRFKANMMLPSEWTREGLISLLQEQPEGAMVSYEFKSLLSLLQRDYNAGAQSILTELYDCPDQYIRKTGVSPIKEFRVNAPFLSILAASTMEWLLEAVKGKDVSGGFLARFIFVSANKKEKSYAIQPPSDPLKKRIAIENLQSILNTGGELEYEPAAKEYYESWYYKFVNQCETAPESVRAFFPRLTTYVHKFAMLEAVIHRHEKLILLQDCKNACHTGDELALEIHKLEGANLGKSVNEKNLNNILRIVRDNPGITRRELLQRSHLLGKQFGEVLNTVTETGQIILKEGGFYHANC